MNNSFFKFVGSFRSFFGSSPNARYNSSRQYKRNASLNPRRAGLEQLEDRTLLSVSPTDFAAIREAYPEFNLPENQALVNTIEISADNLSVESLQAALDKADASEKTTNLIVVRTTETSNTITFGEEDATLRIQTGSDSDDAVSIVGYGDAALTVDGSNVTSLFSIAGGIFNFGNLNFTNGSGQIQTVYDEEYSQETEIVGGGAVFAYDVVDVMFANCAFTNNGAKGTDELEVYGGALYIGEASTLTIQNCQFTENATEGVEIQEQGETDGWNGVGGAIYAEVINDISVTQSNFKGNESSIGGAIHVVGSQNLTIQNSTFTDNVAKAVTESAQYGYAEETLLSESFSTYDYSSEGGALYVSGGNVAIKSSQFNGNQAGGFGGAVWLGVQGVDVSDSEFSANVAQYKTKFFNASYTETGMTSYTSLVTYDTGEGGALWISAETVDFTNSDFIENQAAISGGAVHIGAGEINITDCNASGNVTSMKTENSNVNNYDNGKVANKWFSSNSGATGGAFHISGEIAVIKGSVFEDNLCEGTGGGAIRFDDGELTVQGCHFIGNSALSPNESKNESYDENGSQIGTDVSNSKAGEGGGAIFSTGQTTTVVDSDFENNKADGSGGAISVEVSYDGGEYEIHKVKIDKCRFSNNSAQESYESSSSYGEAGGASVYNGGSGGAVHAESVEITDSVFRDNVAGMGGAVYVSSYASIVNSELTGNEAFGTCYSYSYGETYEVEKTGQGGAVYTDDGLCIANSTIADNSAHTGGGLYVYDNADLYNSIVARNKATEKDGGNDIYAYEEADISGYNVVSSFEGWGEETDGSTVDVYDPDEPLFTGNSYALAKGSQAIDRGDDEYAVYDDGEPIEYDLAGKDRIIGSCVDLGAYEYDPSAIEPEQLAQPGLKFVSATSSAVALTIDGVANASGYLVKYSTDSSFSTSETQKFDEAGDVDVEKLTSGKTYYFQVQALGDDVYYLNSDWSETVTATTLEKLATPTVTVDSSKTTGESVTLNIGEVANATSYVVTVTDEDGEVVMTKTTKNYGSFVVSNLEPMTNYTFSVVAEGSSQYESSDAAKVSAKTINVRLETPTVSVASTTHNAMTVKVSEVKGAEGYKVKLATDAQFTQNVVETEVFKNSPYTIEGLKSSTKYYVCVQAIGDGYNYADSAWSTKSVDGTTQTQLASPTVSVDTAKTTGNSVTLNIGRVTNATSYVVTVKNEDGEVVTTKTARNAGSFAVTGLEPKTSYTFSVVAQGSSRYVPSDAVEVSAKTINVRLAAPTVSVASTTHNAMTVKVSEVKGAEGYKVKLATDFKFTKGVVETEVFKDSPYTIEGLKSGTNYYVSVQAIGDGDNYADSVWSTKNVYGTTLTQLASPKVTVDSAKTTSNSVTLNIGNVTNATSYVVTVKNENGEVVTTKTAKSSGTFAVTGLDPKTSYTFSVVAQGSSRYVPSEATELQVSTPAGKLTTPTIKIDATSCNTISVSFSEVKGAEGYKVKLATDAKFTKGLVVSDEIQDSEYTFEGLKSGTTYYVGVQAIGDGKDYGDSEWSTGTKVATAVQLKTPTISVKSTTDTTATVNIGNVSNATQYVVVYTNLETAENGTRTFKTSGTQTIKGLEARTEYSFVVYATGNSAYAPSEFSKEVFATTTYGKLEKPVCSVSNSGSAAIITLEGDSRVDEGYYVEVSLTSNFSNVIHSFDVYGNYSYDFGEYAQYLRNVTFYFRVRANATEDLQASDWATGTVKANNSTTEVDVIIKDQPEVYKAKAFAELFADGELLEL